VRRIDINAAKVHLSRLFEAVATAEELILVEAAKSVARLLPLEPRRRPRKPGLLKGKIGIADDFADPLPSEIIAAFRGERP
jgi:antitoxin (DNA-binding transcriptional repressor) of toxin-antitoxin stability system